MLIGGWGQEAIELLAEAAGEAGEPLDRHGSLALLGAAGATEGGWRCWLSGRLTNATELRQRFPAAQPEDLAAAVALAHARLGPPACDLLRGTFILVAADAERGSASVTRDQLGGRPLVYARVGRGVLFAEHERDLIARLATAPGPDRRAVTQWIDGGGLSGRRTFYAGIERVPPGHRLALSGSGAVLERYWTPRYQGTASGTREELAEHLRSETFAAIDRAGAGARRPAVRLSGGLDSACVAAGLAAQGSAGEGALALSAVFPGSPETDERDLIEATARQAGLASELVSFAQPFSILAPALRCVERWRLPSVTPNLFVWEPTMERARELGVDVMLDGEGGDELFGLAPYLIADALRAGRIRSAWKLSAGIPGVGEDPDPRTRLRALRVFGTGALTPEWARRRRRRHAAAGSEGSLLGREDRLAIADEDERSAWRVLDGPRWWRGLAADLTGGGDELDVAGQLRRESIDAGIDRRQPLLFDLDLVCAVLANPPQLQFDPIRDRSLLRDALAGYIPEQVRCRYAKSYFTPVLAAALSGSDRGSLVGPLSEPNAPVRSFLRGESLDWMLGQSGSIPPVRAMSLWRIAMVDAWLRSAWPE
jgi:asparagine synthase (glutamine-hydrolysing)